MFGLVTDEILAAFSLVTDAESLPGKLKERDEGLADPGPPSTRGGAGLGIMLYRDRPAVAVHAFHAGRERCVLEEARGGVLESFKA